MDTAVKVVGIMKKYNKVKVLDEINLELEKGKIYGLIGKSGAGKQHFLEF